MRFTIKNIQTYCTKAQHFVLFNNTIKEHWFILLVLKEILCIFLLLLQYLLYTLSERQDHLLWCTCHHQLFHVKHQVLEEIHYIGLLAARVLL